MILTKSELIGSLQHEVRILSHLAGKVERAAVDYRPTPKQRSTLELLQYMSIMGPQLIEAVKRGGFDVATWTAAQQEANARNFDQTVAAIEKQRELYPALLADFTDADFRREIEMFGQKSTVGAFIVNSVLGAIRRLPHAALLLFESMRSRGAQHDEPVGGNGRARAGERIG